MLPTFSSLKLFGDCMSKSWSPMVLLKTNFDVFDCFQQTNHNNNEFSKSAFLNRRSAEAGKEYVLLLFKT